jgi:hypothetical protein
MSEQFVSSEFAEGGPAAVHSAEWALFDVHVRNELTGEVRVLTIAAPTAQAGQVMAVTAMFREHAWRKAVALAPLPTGA